MPLALDTPIAISAALSLLLLTVALLVAFIRLARGPALLDRVVALDLIAAICLGIIGAYSVISGSTVVLNAAAILALTSFLGTVAIARFLERRQK